jgi:hypothetical protein
MGFEDEAEQSLRRPCRLTDREVRESFRLHIGPLRRLPQIESKDCFLNRAGHPTEAYLRAAQAYMLISMPTDTSTIFGAFQAI